MSPAFDSFIAVLIACEAISHVRRIKSISAADLMTRSSCSHVVGDSNTPEFDPRPRTISRSTSGRSVAFSSYQHVLDRLPFDKRSTTFANDVSGCASSTPKKPTECSTPVRGPSQSSSCLSFGRMKRIDRNAVESSSCTNARMLSGSRQPVK